MYFDGDRFSDNSPFVVAGESASLARQESQAHSWIATRKASSFIATSNKFPLTAIEIISPPPPFARNGRLMGGTRPSQPLKAGGEF